MDEIVLNNRFKNSGNYLDQFGSNKISVLLCEGTKPNISMISGFVDLWDPLFMDFDIPNDFKQYKKNYGNLFLEKILFSKYGFHCVGEILRTELVLMLGF